MPLASLAKPCPKHSGFADRVELYVNGMELENGFGAVSYTHILAHENVLDIV